MISEIENTIGNCERVFDIARNKLEKIVIALEEEAELHGAPSQKLFYDLATATADLSVAIDALNAAYVLRDSKQPPRHVPPAESYIELFKKNAAAKRAALASAREEEAQAAAQTTYDSAIRASAPPITPVAPRRFEPKPLARPAACELQDVIDEIECRLNKVSGEIFAMEKPGESSGILGLKRAREEKEIKASGRAKIDSILADVLPPYEKKMAELAQLREEHKNLLMQLGDAKKAAEKS
jgi:hypothetical protein